MMPQAKKQIIPTRWPGGAVIGIPVSRKLSAMANLLAQTRLRARWNNDLGMVEFYKVSK